MNSALKLRFLGFASLAVLAGATLCASRVGAQSAAEAARIAANLEPASRAVIERLSSLRELPDGAWKVHSSDLAHGEAVNLNESGWQAIKPQTKAPNEAVWFRQTYRCRRR